MTVDGKTTRTCYKCGHKREYDMTTMRFVTGHFVSNLVKSKGKLPPEALHVCL